MSALASIATLLVAESGCGDVAVDWVVARGTCVIIATGLAMGVAVRLVVLIPVGSSWVTSSAGGTAIAVVGAASTNQNPRRTNRNQDNESYCHTHGRTCRDDHTSSTCNHPADGHVTTATIGDKKGGNTRYC